MSKKFVFRKVEKVIKYNVTIEIFFTFKVEGGYTQNPAEALTLDSREEAERASAYLGSPVEGFEITEVRPPIQGVTREASSTNQSLRGNRRGFADDFLIWKEGIPSSYGEYIFYVRDEPYPVVGLYDLFDEPYLDKYFKEVDYQTETFTYVPIDDVTGYYDTED
jgi:hypothetical protein